MSTLSEILISEQKSYAARKAEIADARIRLDEEERRLDMNMARLVEVVMEHTTNGIIPEPRPPQDEVITTE